MAGSGLVICVTNDISYDQRVLRISKALRNAYQNKITLVGRNLSGNYNGDDPEFTFKRFSCFFNRGAAFYLEYNLRLFFFLLNYREEYQSVCCCDADTLLGGMTAAKILSKKRIYDAHEWFVEVPELLGKSLKKKIWTLIEQYGIKQSHLRYTVGPLLAEKLTQYYRSNFEVIRNVPTENIRKGATEGRDNIIIYQGAVNKGRGLEVLLDLAPLIPNYQIWIIGDGDIKSELIFEKQKRNILNVEFMEKQKPALLKKYTQKAKFGYNLLDNVSLSYHFSLANKFFDYAASGVVSINSNLPEYFHLIKEYQHAILIPGLDAREIATSLLRISESEREEMVSRGFIMISENNWEIESQKLISLYRPFLV